MMMKIMWRKMKMKKQMILITNKVVEVRIVSMIKVKISKKNKM
jgi:hypothetical protein